MWHSYVHLLFQKDACYRTEELKTLSLPTFCHKSQFWVVLLVDLFTEANRVSGEYLAPNENWFGVLSGVKALPRRHVIHCSLL